MAMGSLKTYQSVFDSYLNSQAVQQQVGNANQGSMTVRYGSGGGGNWVGGAGGFGSFGTLSPVSPASPKLKKKGFFKKGDIVRDVDGVLDTVRSVPGDPEYDSVGFTDADAGMRLQGVGWTYQHLWVLDKPAAPKELQFDLAKLDSLVIAKEVKDEIQAVLKQHKNSKKLFEEWGLAETIEYGKGMTFLFHGTPGTGKTWGANCIAKVVGQELLTLGAAEIQTSEPGGANRNIQNAFKTAKEEGKVLFLDECDSLITSRDDVGMILGSEINTLLTEIEKYEGICILATNRIENLDEALERRISLIVEFPEPTFDQRKAIFEKLIPKKMPLGKDVLMEKLAEHKLTGGQIKNVVIQAARLALSDEAKQVDLKYFDSAIERLQKSKSLMGSRARYHPLRVKSDFVKTSA